MNFTEIIENIVKPNDLKNLSFNFNFFRIERHLHNYNILISYNVNNEINIFETLNWFKYKIKQFSEKNCIKSLKLINWDDTKEFDFDVKYELYIILSIESYEFSKLKNDSDSLNENYIAIIFGKYLLN